MDSLNRRTVLKSIGMASASLALPRLSVASGAADGRPVKLGVIADLHGGFAVDAQDRLNAFCEEMKTAEPAAVLQLGDFAYPNGQHQSLADQYNNAHPCALHVIGNHEFDHGLTRKDCYRAWGISASYYRRDVAGICILVLDGNEAGSPAYEGGYHSYIGAKQQAWLEAELDAANKPVLIVSHQPLAGVSAIDNASALQQLLSKYQSKILLCLNGHSHVDSHVQVDGVSYLHINSASYYWVGGEKRLLYYADPLFTTVTIDWQTATINVASRVSRWKEKSPQEIGYFQSDDAPTETVVTPRIRPHHISRSELKVMTWNIWGRLNQDARYDFDGTTARQRTIEIIRQSGADVVAMIETYGSAADIARDLNFHYQTPAADGNLCIFSRYPLSDVELLEGLNPFSFIAATVNLPGGQKVRIYDIWLTSEGRHIVGIKDKSITDEQFTRGDDNRFKHLTQLLDHSTFQRDLKAADSVPLIVAGDFNCVSHLDYTAATRKLGVNYSRILSTEVSRAMQRAGFTDTFRAAHANITADNLGHTWTTVGTDYVFERGGGFLAIDNHPRPEYQNPYTRIDYIYACGDKLQVTGSKVLRHHPKYPDQKFPAFPSDHAAVVTDFRLSGD